MKLNVSFWGAWALCHACFAGGLPGGVSAVKTEPSQQVLERLDPSSADWGRVFEKIPERERAAFAFHISGASFGAVAIRGDSAEIVLEPEDRGVESFRAEIPAGLARTVSAVFLAECSGAETGVLDLGFDGRVFSAFSKGAGGLWSGGKVWSPSVSSPRLLALSKIMRGLAFYAENSSESVGSNADAKADCARVLAYVERLALEMRSGKIAGGRPQLGDLMDLGDFREP